MRFYQLIQDKIRFEELKPLITGIFVHDKRDSNQFINNSQSLSQIYIFESQSDSFYENYFFHYPASLCIALKGKAEFYFKDLLIGQLDEINSTKILHIQDYMVDQQFKIVCEPKTEILFMGLGGGKETPGNDNSEENTLKFTNFVQNELHRDIGLHFKSPIDSISVLLDYLENKLKSSSDSSHRDEFVFTEKIRTQLDILESYVKKSIVRSEITHGIESLRLIFSDPVEVLRDFFQDISWDANLKTTYSGEIIKVFIDSYKFKSALREIVSFFLQNKVEEYRHQWVVNFIKGREQIEILFYFSYAADKDPELFDNDVKDVKTISVQDNLPLLNDIILCHKGNTQIFEKDETIKIRIIIPQNLWRLQKRSLNIFVIDPEEESIKQLSDAITDKFSDTNVVLFDNINEAIAGFYQHQPEAIFYNMDSDYDGIAGEKMLNKLHGLFKDSGTDECIFIPISNKVSWSEIEKKYPNLSFNLLKKPFIPEELEKTVQSLFSFINRYKVLRHSYKNVKMSAERDSVTGLYNRWYLDEYCSDLYQKSKDSKGHYSLIIADIDNFKIYNDTNGHQLGDKALQKFSRVLSGSVRLSDTVARYGGEEFVIVLPHTTKENALKISEKIRLNVENEPFENGIAQPLKKVTASFGVASYPDDGADNAVVLKKADMNLYQAKEKGRNQVIG